MGGLIIDVSDMHNIYSELILAPEAVIELARRGIFFDVPRRSIDDKSKVNCLAKALALCQVSWLAVQSIARHICDLPISLTEIHTLIHIGFASCLYLLWWLKPKNIGDATRVSTQLYQDDIAELLIFHEADDATEIGGIDLSNDSWHGLGPRVPENILLSTQPLEVNTNDLKTMTPAPNNRTTDAFDYQALCSTAAPITKILRSGESLDCGIGVRSDYGAGIFRSVKYELSDKDILRWTRASSKLQSLAAQGRLYDTTLNMRYFRSRTSNIKGGSALRFMGLSNPK